MKPTTVKRNPRRNTANKVTNAVNIGTYELYDFVPRTNLERPKCDAKAIRSSRMREREYLRLDDEIARHLRRKYKHYENSYVDMIDWARTDPRLTEKVERVFYLLQYIGKQGCKVQERTKKFLANFVNLIRVQTGQSSSQATKQQQFGAYNELTKENLINLIFDNRVWQPRQKWLKARNNARFS